MPPWGKWRAQGKEAGCCCMSPQLGPESHSLVRLQNSTDEEGNECVGENEPIGFSVHGSTLPQPAEFAPRGEVPVRGPSQPQAGGTHAGRPHAMGCFALIAAPTSLPPGLGCLGPECCSPARGPDTVSLLGSANHRTPSGAAPSETAHLEHRGSESAHRSPTASEPRYPCDQNPGLWLPAAGLPPTLVLLCAAAQSASHPWDPALSPIGVCLR